MPGSFTPDIGRTSISVETGFLSQDLKVESIWYTAKKIERRKALIHVDLDQIDLELEMKPKPASEDSSRYSLSTSIRKTFFPKPPMHYQLSRVELEETTVEVVTLFY